MQDQSQTLLALVLAQLPTQVLDLALALKWTRLLVLSMVQDHLKSSIVSPERKGHIRASLQPNLQRVQKAE